MKHLHRCIAAALLLASSSTPAAANYAPRAPRDQLALELAVVAAHEGALDNVNDTRLVWQVVEARGHTTAERLKFLRGHSPHALGLPSKKGPCMPWQNCSWSVQLLKHPNRTPTGFKKGWWEAARAEDWFAVLRKAQDLVYEIDLERPCLGTPYSWGYAGDLQSAWLDRRLVPMGCAGTRNDGFTAYKPDAKPISARLARGSR